MSDFKKLLVWQKSNALAVRVVRATGTFKRAHPRLADQMSRSAESIPDAISEGRSRRTDKEFAHYLTVGVGSANELEGQIQRAFDLRLISEKLYAELTE